MNNTIKSIHRTVLLNEAIENLELGNKAIIVDATFGGGGHSLAILEMYPNARVIAFDRDKTAWQRVEKTFLGIEKRFSFINANFRDLKQKLAEEDLDKVDAILFDLGLSSDQLENSGRGFSFKKNEPLLMTMNDTPLTDELNASMVVNEWSEENLAKIIRGFGEEKFAGRISRAIVERRNISPINTTFDLAQIIEKVVPSFYRRGRIHPATKTFQAIRIAVNDELGALKKGLEDGFNILRTGGRMAVISFHSLEDRTVKIFFREKKDNGEGKIIFKKPVTPRADEVKENPRSRSAKLRVLEKL